MWRLGWFRYYSQTSVECEISKKCYWWTAALKIDLSSFGCWNARIVRRYNLSSAHDMKISMSSTIGRLREPTLSWKQLKQMYEWISTNKLNIRTMQKWNSSTLRLNFLCLSMFLEQKIQVHRLDSKHEMCAFRIRGLWSLPTSFSFSSFSLKRKWFIASSAVLHHYAIMLLILWLLRVLWVSKLKIKGSKNGTRSMRKQPCSNENKNLTKFNFEQCLIVPLAIFFPSKITIYCYCTVY